MCNSVFINYLSSSLSVAINKVEVDVGANKDVICLSHSFSFDKTIKIGSLQTSNTQNFLLKAIIKEREKANIPIKVKFDGKELEYTISYLKENKSNEKLTLFQKMSNSQIEYMFNNSSHDFIFQYVKAWLYKIVKEGIKSSNLTRSTEKLDVLYDTIEAILSHYSSLNVEENGNDSLKAKLSSLMSDLKSGETHQGQIYKAFEKASWFKKWGVHYLK